MGELKDIVEQASVTSVHRFIKTLQEQKKLLRCYTQNIDCLEERVGLKCDVNDKVLLYSTSLYA
jgi:NAD-dependent histone deacetylase SIR2